MEYRIWKQKLVKSYKLENKTLSKELQDYRVKYIFEIEKLQDYISLKGKVIGLQESFYGRGGYLGPEN